MKGLGEGREQWKPELDGVREEPKVILCVVWECVLFGCMIQRNEDCSFLWFTLPENT